MSTEPTPQSDPHWNLKHLHEHIQYAADLELWTIPFYMSAMYSVINRTSQQFQLIQSVINQEMLHLQSVANIGNAYGYSPKISVPVYAGQTIPHLDFNLDVPNPTQSFQPYTAEIGPLDIAHINAMCLIEYPEWDSSAPVSLKQNVKEYANIGDFYRALRYGAGLFKDRIKGGINQVNYFSAYYRLMPGMTITENGSAGFNQVGMLIDLITDQGEGSNAGQNNDPLIANFQNTADDLLQTIDHFEKFEMIKNNMQLQETYAFKPVSDYTDYDRQLVEILKEHFNKLRNRLDALFVGENPDDFIPTMVSVGAAIQNCWKNGVTPQFS
ncbi:ferritin-like domain-containing protein [Mucilaginibacter jinjuensis]|uniref:Ferritin-like domain-containing protein n=1 Tax=Mucilaginibacter jinjuensis TaxID=1176721 RepID=A0ABY7TB95_9SPHI|nr:ferritin-like domain-containing protein [Mucilaginibacter jinjuensis]WCT13784.1 ferritin-like domain-containing protein [Mucilaginibacter jinjuensis]